MGEMASFWGYEESNDMEQLGHKLLCTTLELEKFKGEAMEEMRKNKECIDKLIRLLKFAIQERDEARNHFHKLLNNTTTTTTMPLNDVVVPLFKPNSSITESNSLSEPYNYSPSPAVDSLFDAVSSPDFNLIPNHINSTEIDEGSLIIDNLVKGRVLPQKGKLMEAVIQAGSILQPLMVAGPLPRWRNPPQMQAFQIPPVSIKGYEATTSFSAPSAPPMMNFGNLSLAGNCGSSASMMNVNSYSPLAKRQRFG